MAPPQPARAELEGRGHREQPPGCALLTAVAGAPGASEARGDGGGEHGTGAGRLGEAQTGTCMQGERGRDCAHHRNRWQQPTQRRVPAHNRVVGNSARRLRSRSWWFWPSWAASVTKPTGVMDAPGEESDCPGGDGRPGVDGPLRAGHDARKDDGERRADTDFADDLDGAAHRLDEPLTDREAEPNAVVAAGVAGVSLGERLEQVRHELRLDPASLVGDRQLEPAVG